MSSYTFVKSSIGKTAGRQLTCSTLDSMRLYTRNAAARCCLRYTLSSAKVANLGYALILSFLPLVVVPRAATEGTEGEKLLIGSEAGFVAVGAMVYDVSRYRRNGFKSVYFAVSRNVRYLCFLWFSVPVFQHCSGLPPSS